VQRTMGRKASLRARASPMRVVTLLLVPRAMWHSACALGSGQVLASSPPCEDEVIKLTSGHGVDVVFAPFVWSTRASSALHGTAGQSPLAFPRAVLRA